MRKIGLLSDTHGFLDDKVFEFFSEADQIWHAGDIGNLELADRLAAFKPLIAVHGNIDDASTRLHYPGYQRFMCEEIDVLLTHIGGYPGKYDHKVFKILHEQPPKLFICGHSHILKVMYDKKLEFLYINPGACGICGFHRVRTMIRFEIDGSAIKNLEVMEIPRNN